MTSPPPLTPRIAAPAGAPNGHAPGVGATAADRVLGQAQLAAIRLARATLLDAARRGDTAEIEAGIPPFVQAMCDADFARPTICSLVAAAIDAGLPTARGAIRRGLRADALARWTRLAGALADEGQAR